jgi:glycine dehydrogenase subunit 2
MQQASPAKPIPTLFESSREGASGVSLPQANVVCAPWQPQLPLRQRLARLPQTSQLEVMRHFVQLSQRNMGIDSTFYPLGSCTMKFNPKVCDTYGALDGLTTLHPEAPDHQSQGTLKVIHTLQTWLADITGFSAVSLQPAAGAQGELVGMMMIKAHFAHTGQTQRTEVIIPDSAHGTNPASAMMCGFKVVELRSGPDGLVDVAKLASLLSDKTAAVMLTNPNTLGLFEKDILEITRLVHAAGGLMYYDGANLNAVMGQAKPAAMGFDVMHINTHKTFATPHGGGGPGCGPVAVGDTLAPYLPTPLVAFHPDQPKGYQYRLATATDCPLSIGRVKTFFGNVEMMIRSWTYIAAYGYEGLSQVSQDAVLNANYLKEHLKDHYHLAYNQVCKHEFVLTSLKQKTTDERLTTMALAKRLMDYGYHPPTVYFPLIVYEALMIEPTDTESKPTLDAFIEAMRAIATECVTAPDIVATAPHTTVVGKVDEVAAARNLNVNFYANL